MRARSSVARKSGLFWPRFTAIFRAKRRVARKGRFDVSRPRASLCILRRKRPPRSMAESRARNAFRGDLKQPAFYVETFRV